MTSSPVIDVDNLNVWYGAFHAVKNVSFQVRRGELYALLGTNGAGKTSTLETVEGHRAASSGTVRVFGHSPLDRGAVRPRMGVMLQESGFSPDLTVRETVRLIGKLSGRTGSVGHVLAIAGLTEKASTRVSQLSGGEKRRLDFATAVYGTPELVFLDEPTTGLDAEGRQETWELVRALRDGGTTVLLTTHYLEEAEALADRVAILHEGRIAAAGTPDEVTAAQPSRISLELPAGLALGDLPPLAELGVTGHETDGRVVRLRTRTLQRTATELLLWARRAGVELRGLDVRSASLEEAFLGIARDVSAPRAQEPKEEKQREEYAA